MTDEEDEDRIVHKSDVVNNGIVHEDDIVDEVNIIDEDDRDVMVK